MKSLLIGLGFSLFCLVATAEDVLIDCPVQEPLDYFGYIAREKDKTFTLFVHKDSGWNSESIPNFNPLHLTKGKFKTNDDSDNIFVFAELDFIFKSNGQVEVKHKTKDYDDFYPKSYLEGMRCFRAYRSTGVTF
jgi:hypothetical protein